MAKTDKPEKEGKVACEVCLKEIPQSEAKSEEAADYVAYFCGLECYAKWHAKEQQPPPPPKGED